MSIKYTHEQLSVFGRVGGKIGGPIGAARRHASLSPEQRSSIARRAIKARWNRWRAKHGLPLKPVEPYTPVSHPPKPPTNQMKTSFQYRGYQCAIERGYDSNGRRTHVVIVAGRRHPYSWQVNKPLTPKQYCENLISAAVEKGEEIQTPTRANSETPILWHNPR